MSLAQLSGLLGLSEEQGRDLCRDIKAYLSRPDIFMHLRGKHDCDRARKTKIAIVEKSINLLRDHRWGEKWFPASLSMPGQKFSWPDDSTS